MKASLYHVQLNVSDAKVSLPFYKDFFSYLEYKIIEQSSEHICFSNSTTDFWIIETDKVHKENKFHRKNTGLNHLAFRLNSKEEVDLFVADFLKTKGIATLYETPKAFPEYGGEYYSVFFEDPDRIKLEVMYRN
jgi:catechol 2,3-dioxygenase-like lactoylglutathione lyase family enzyme